jgi:hypothetical protein
LQRVEKARIGDPRLQDSQSHCDGHDDRAGRGEAAGQQQGQQKTQQPTGAEALDDNEKKAPLCLGGAASLA